MKHILDLLEKRLCLASVSGYVYNDLNANGLRDIGDVATPLTGITAYLDLNGNKMLDDGEPNQQTSARLGKFEFGGLAEGTYTVRLKLTDRFTQTAPVENGGRTVAVSGDAHATVDPFGVAVKYRIAGFVYGDANRNGVRDTGENALLSGQKVYLDTNNNSSLDDGEPTFTTNLDGFWFNVTPGTYQVRLSVKPGWTQSQPKENAGYTVTIPMPTNTGNPEPLYFGTYETPIQKGSITGVVWNDADADGTRDAGELPIAGAIVYLDQNRDKLLNTGEIFTTTDGDGRYAFAELAAGEYMVREQLPEMWKQTYPQENAGHLVNLLAGQSIGDKHFGRRKEEPRLGSIAGLSWSDLNADGVRQNTEPLQAGKTIYLDANKNGKLDVGEKSTITNSEGRYKFSSLVAGSYRVRRVVPGGYRLTIPAIGYYDLSLSAGQNVVEKNFATTERALVSGRVFRDTNNDKKLSDGEIGLSGWTIYIDQNKNGKFDDGERSTTSTTSGEWSFKNLSPGNYRFRIVQKSGYKLTLPELGYYDVTLTSGQIKTGLFFGQRPINVTI